MARTTYVKHAQQRYRTVPVLDENGKQKVTQVLAKDGSPKTTKGGRAIQRRVTVEDHSQPLPNRRCNKCGREIEVGNPYKWIQLMVGASKQRKNFCNFCPIRQSDTTTSGNLATLYSAIEAAEDVLDDGGPLSLGDIAQALSEAATGVTEAAEAYAESAENMEQGFGHETSSSQEVQEKAEQLEQFASDLEDKAAEIEGMEDPDDVHEDSVLVEADEPTEPLKEDFFHDEMTDDQRSDAEQEYEAALIGYEGAREAYEQAVEDAITEEKDRLREVAVDAAQSALAESPL